jgi:hypothetical protein
MANTKKSPKKTNMKPGDVIVTPTGAYEVNKNGKPIKMSEANRVRAGFPPGDTGMPVSARQQTTQQRLAKKKTTKAPAKQKKK